MSQVTQTNAQETAQLLSSIQTIIERKSQQAAIYLNNSINQLYWEIGCHIIGHIQYEVYSDYGKRTLATLSQELTARFGKGYSYSALTRMVKVASTYEKGIFATVSQTLSWSHFIELVSIEDHNKRLYYQHMSIIEHWSVRTLRKNQEQMLYERSTLAKQPHTTIATTLQNTQNSLVPDLVFKSTYVLDFLGLSGSYSEKDLENAIVAQLEKFILELGQGFAFLERQKRLSIDSIDYYLDLLFYHRKLNRLVAIDLKLGKFKPTYKAQMELYLKYLQKYEQQPHEQPPIGLLLCSEGNSEHIELLLLGEENIKVAQYLTQLPDKQWFIDKLHKSISIVQHLDAGGEV